MNKYLKMLDEFVEDEAAHGNIQIGYYLKLKGAISVLDEDNK